MRSFVDTVRELMRKRNEKFISTKVTPAHAKLQERVGYVAQFRAGHEHLRQTILHVSKPLEAPKKDGESVNLIREVDSAYEAMAAIDVLDLSADGDRALNYAETTYL